MKIRLNSSQILSDDGSQLWISIPKTKDKFQISKKLVYIHDWYMVVYLPEEMTFNCIHGKIQHYQLTSEQLMEQLAKSEIPRTNEHSKVYHHIPATKEAIKVEPDSDLIR